MSMPQKHNTQLKGKPLQKAIFTFHHYYFTANNTHDYIMNMEKKKKNLRVKKIGPTFHNIIQGQNLVLSSVNVPVGPCSG
jgi:hypothetical protein